ncbi:TIGR02281 family clan AA aspartic protease [Aurantimonas sp. Leaf443]|uniref:retropepsin-like aspartic protease family protein n=1 Tax=Aurantimonas sp. Leaf443 TaxID=1736378 RepID=UPI0006F80E21|nr:TIGR02281 family clan AA aspartic protease [Aurantimonas sp. Leaf443]KQT83052.1 hypothetical protein ASG48_13785 [Aurantimonas sp. Leaf443]
MHKFLAVLAATTLIGLATPSVFEVLQRRQAQGVETIETPEAPLEASLAPRMLRLALGPDGHARTQARLNGRAVPVLVDTGATRVALDAQTARRLGLSLRPADFTASVETANGPARAALVTLDRVEIGAVSAREVEALVLEGAGLPTVLLGMSFLKRLSSVSIRDGQLELRQ